MIGVGAAGFLGVHVGSPAALRRIARAGTGEGTPSHHAPNGCAVTDSGRRRRSLYRASEHFGDARSSGFRGARLPLRADGIHRRLDDGARRETPCIPLSHELFGESVIIATQRSFDFQVEASFFHREVPHARDADGRASFLIPGLPLLECLAFRQSSGRRRGGRLARLEQQCATRRPLGSLDRA